MTEKAVYLKPGVVIEPLYQQWYAWSHLISPATAALNVLNRHLPIMDSYLKAPAVHERFSSSATMLGAPFMAHPADRAAEVRALRDRTRNDFPHILEFAEAICSLTRLLEEEAHGYSLDGLYEKVPSLLQGYVELSYSLDNHPVYRFFEPLLYRSRYYDVSAQSVALYVVEPDGRPFVLSTPRLTADEVLHLQIPFAHPGLDALFAMRLQPGSYSHVKDLLGITAAEESLFSVLFTQQPPLARTAASRGGVQVRYLGHACVLLESNGISLLTDPAVTSANGPGVPRYTYADLPARIDYVLITHNHQDHVLFDTLLQLRHKIGHIVVPRNAGGTLEDPSLKLMFEALGFKNVLQLEELESLGLHGCTVTGVPFLGEHADLSIRSKLAYHLRFEDGFAVLFAADSCNIEPAVYRLVQDLLGDIDMLFLGMECDGAPLSWLYGPLLPHKVPREMDHSRRLAGSDYERGRELVRQFNPSEVYVYAMGQEPWLRHIMALEYTGESRPIVASNALIDYCRRRGIAAERLFGRGLVTRVSRTTEDRFDVTLTAGSVD
jgi:L-ascorbate metabolism protein UlaG (beta-lactamase superfamily)